jgi:hypothetical protein
MRSDDLAIRWGGEEFLILLPNTPLDDAVPLAERVRNLVATTPQVASDPVTISFGVGQWRPGESVAAFVERIDAAKYAAKSGGRNRVVASPWRCGWVAAQSVLSPWPVSLVQGCLRANIGSASHSRDRSRSARITVKSGLTIAARAAPRFSHSANSVPGPA